MFLSYHRFTRGKDLSKRSNEDIECILGKRKKQKIENFELEEKEKVENFDSEKKPKMENFDEKVKKKFFADFFFFQNRLKVQN